MSKSSQFTSLGYLFWGWPWQTFQVKPRNCEPTVLPRCSKYLQSVPEPSKHTQTILILPLSSMIVYVGTFKNEHL